MKTYEITTKVEIDEGVIDNFKAFGGAIVDLFKGDDTGNTSNNTSNSNSANSSGTSDSGGNSLANTIAQAKKKVSNIGGDGNKKTGDTLKFSDVDKQGNAVVKQKETVQSFKKWLRSDGPGRTKFAKDKTTGKPGPKEYAAQITALYAKGYSLRALEILKVFRSATSAIKPQTLATIKSAAAKQAQAIGLK